MSLQLGTVRSLWRYPVKSMAGQALAAAELTWAGLAGDRRWAFVRANAQRNGFPWQTNRENPTMCRYMPVLVDPDHPDKSDVEVQTPNGERFLVHDPALAAELGVGVQVMRMDRGAFDAMPISLISAQTMTELSALAQVPADERRFRPNLVIEPTVRTPYVEDEWVGCVLHIGQAALRVDARDTRCVVVNVDPEAGRPNAALLKVIGSERQARAGAYGTVVKPGLIQAGDPVKLIPPPPTAR